MPKLKNLDAKDLKAFQVRPHPGGRPRKENKDQWGQITAVLRKDTIERLRAGADSKHFGEYLQHHLDRYPPPTREQYLSITEPAAKAGTVGYWTTFKRKKVATLMAHSTSKESRKLSRERARLERLTPEERAWKDRITEAVKKTVEATYAGDNP